MIHGIATAQRNMILAFTVAVCGRLVHWSVSLVALVVFATFCFQLARALRRSLPALYVLLAIVPLVNLVVLLVLNNAATKALRDAGIDVGFLGVIQKR